MMGGGGGGGGMWQMIAQGVTDIANSALGQWQANKAAHKTRKFIKNMYKHRYQWEMEDMKKAGLNPILAAGTGAPGAASPGIGEVAGNKGSSAISTGIQARLAQASTALMQKEAELTEQKKWTEIQLADKIANESDSTAYDMWLKRANILNAIEEAALGPQQRRAIINEVDARAAAHSARAATERAILPQHQFRSSGGGSVGPLLDTGIINTAKSITEKVITKGRKR